MAEIKSDLLEADFWPGIISGLPVILPRSIIENRPITLLGRTTDAPANWLADVEKWRENLGVTHEHLSYEMGFWNVEGSSAYALVSGTLTVTIKGESVVRTGNLAYTFANREGVWAIEAQAWGRTS